MKIQWRQFGWLLPAACAIVAAFSLVAGMAEGQGIDATPGEPAQTKASVLFWAEDFSDPLPPDTYYVTATPGSGIVDSGSFLLTESAQSERGRIFYLTPAPMAQFETTFQLYLGNDDGGGDGAAFLFCPVYDYPPDAGGTLDANCRGGYLVAFDTWDGAPDSVYVAHDSVNNRLLSVNVPNLEDGAWHTAMVSLDAPNIVVTLDGNPVINAPIPGFTPFSGYLGFSGATGGGVNEQRVDSIEVYLPETGALHGHVYDDVTGDPITGATVIAGTFAADTDASGYYTVTLLPGSYDVVAEHPWYVPATASGVVIVTDTVTTQDFSLGSVLVMDPLSLAVTVNMGVIQTEPLVLENAGAVDVDFEIIEMPGAFLPAHRGAPVEVTVPASPGPPPAGSAVATAPYTAPPEQVYTVVPRAALDPAPDVLLLHADVDSDYGSPMQALLQAYGDLGAVDLYNARVTTPGLAELEAYDVVLTWSNYPYGSPAGIGDVLADYVDRGGKVINLMFSLGTHEDRMQGRFMDENYTAMNGAEFYFPFPNVCLGSYDHAHPIMAGVTDVCDRFLLAGTYLTPGSYEVARWAHGELFVAVKSDRPVVSIMGYIGGMSAPWTGQMPDVVHNAILWLGDVPWLSTAPVTGTVPAGGQVVVDVTFDSTAVSQPGDYPATLKIRTDTPYGTRPVPVTMTVVALPTYGKLRGTVTGLGYCDAEPAALEAADVLIEGSTGLTWALTTDPAGYYQLWLDEANSPLVVTVTYPGHLPGELTGVTVTGQQTTTLDVGLRVPEPCMSLTPPSMAATLLPGTAETQPLTLINAGAVPSAFYLYEREPKLPALTLAAGGPDPFGYIYADSNQTEGPAYDWIEIAPPAGGSGLSLGMTGWDDFHYWPIGLPWAFRFYGTEYSQLAVSSNGTVYFQNSYSSSYNVPMPGYNGSSLTAFIAHWWDDLYVWPGDVYYQAQGDRVIIEYYQTSTEYSPDHATWEVILFQNGDILMQYQDTIVGDGGDHGAWATVGIQGDVTTGLQYSYDTPALTDGLAICFAYPGHAPHCREDDIPWLAESPITGTVAADGQAGVDVTFAAISTLPLGTYTGTLLVVTGDPQDPTLLVPVTLNIVSCVELTTVDLALVTAGPIFAGDSVTLEADIGPYNVSRPYSYTVHYDDGTPLVTGSSSADPLVLAHSYVLPGIYTVEVTVWNCGMAEPVVDSAVVTVELPTFYYYYLPLVTRGYGH